MYQEKNKEKLLEKAKLAAKESINLSNGNKFAKELLFSFYIKVVHLSEVGSISTSQMIEYPHGYYVQFPVVFRLLWHSLFPKSFTCYIIVLHLQSAYL